MLTGRSVAEMSFQGSFSHRGRRGALAAICRAYSAGPERKRILKFNLEPNYEFNFVFIARKICAYFPADF
jgi:hypothetical protein